MGEEDRVPTKRLQAYFLHTPVPKSTLFVTRPKNSAEIEPLGAPRANGHHRPVGVPRNKTFCRTRELQAVNEIDTSPKVVARRIPRNRSAVAELVGQAAGAKAAAWLSA